MTDHQAILGQSLRPPEFLAGGGYMGERIRTYGWVSTPLGDPQTWPQGLRAVVRLMLTIKTPVSIYWGADAICLYNDAMESALGADRFHSALGASGREVWSEIWAEIGPDIEAVRLGGGGTSHEARYLQLRDGQSFRDSWWNYSQSPIDDPDSPNGIGGVLVISSEITATIQGQQALAAERHRLLSLFENSSMFFAAGTGPDHRFDLANGAYRKLVGGRDLVGRTVREALPEVAEQGLLASLDEVYRTGKPFRARGLPVQLQRQAGAALETRWLDFQYHRVEGIGGGPASIIAEGFDVTDWVLAEMALRSAQGTLEAILSHCPDLVLTIDVDGCIDLAADSSRDILGYDSAEMHGRHFAEVIGGYDVLEVMAGVLSGRAVKNYEATVVRKNGSATTVRWALVWADELKRVIAIGRDASELLVNEDRLRHAQRMEAIGQLTGGVAHDFNNLLTVVIGSLETIVEEAGSSSELQPIARLALDAAERGADVTSQLLSFARRQTQRPVVVTGNDLTGAFAPLARTVLRENIHLELSGLTGAWACMVDSSQLQAALLNLCINARDAMEATGVLMITASTEFVEASELQPGDPQPGVYARIEVTDTGCGMSPDLLKRAVEPFFTTKSVGKGTGLGLSMVYGFVQQSGGFLRIRSQEGVGTSISLYLPCAVRGEVEEAGRQISGPAPTARILIVEDNDLLRQQVVRQLKALGHEVVAAADATEALGALAEGAPFDLLFTDVVMPGTVNGVSLAAQAKAINPQMRVLFTSGYTDQLDLEKVQHLGSLLAKPYKSAALDDAIRAALAGAPRSVHSLGNASSKAA